tara:strand:+ start:2277 stop:2843 length:567 start_codon:yes stop_codon:yes gene_type:complete
MTLFDTVICDYPLPLPDFTEEELEDINSGTEGWTSWNEVEWQTKDMSGMLDQYTIEDDGQIYLRPTNWTGKDDKASLPKEGDLEKFEKTTEINFYQMFMGQEYDYWIEFKAIIWKGELKELELIEFKKEDNSDRLDFQGKMKKEIKTQKTRGKGYRAYRYLFIKPLELIRFLLSFFIGLTLRAERWLP